MDALRAVPVIIAGEWKPVSYVGKLMWEGTATAEEQITALALARGSDGVTTWSRAARGPSAVLRLQLRVEPDETSDCRSVARILMAIQPDGELSGNGRAWLDIRVVLSSDAPFVLSLEHAITGSEFWMAQVRTAGQLKLGALFVCETDTKAARIQLWHLRSNISAGNDPLTKALNYARHGTF